jgi:acetyltransferase
VRPHPFERVLAPRAVAVLGGGEGAVGRKVLENLVAGGFRGALHAVDVPGAEGMPGVHACSLLLEAHGDIDLAVLATPTPALPAAVRACAERRVAGAIIPAGLPGAAARGGGDAALARVLLEEAERGGVRLVGPNSVGLARPGASLDASFTNGGALAGSLGLVSQSGAICAAALDWAAAHRIGFSTVVSLGDAIDVDLGEVLEYLALDEATRAVLVYVESIRSPRALLSGLRLAARIKPVVVVKTGRHGAPRPGEPRASDDAFDAALARTGAVRVPTIRAMFAAAKLLGTTRRVSGNRLAIVANARGLGLLAADRAADLGVAVTPLADETRARLDAVLPAVGEHGNPVDLLGDAGPERYRSTVELCLEDPGVDAVLAMLAPHALSRPLEAAEAVIAAGRARRKPIVACWMGEETVRPARARFAEAGVPELPSPESAVEAVGILASHARGQELLRQLPAPLPPDAMPYLDRAREIVAHALERKRATLTTAELQRLLGAIDVRDRLAGLRVRGTELWVGVSRDPVFGPVLRFGRGAGPGGGLAGEPVVALPPLDTAIIRTLVRTSRLAPVFSPEAGMGPAEVAAFERTLWALSELVSEVPEIRELDMGSLLVAGSEVYAAGPRAEIAPRTPGTGRYDHMAIHPYPADLAERWDLGGGLRVMVRPIRPEDAEMEASFVRNLSDHARHFRFGVALRELTREMLVRFTQIDYDREVALLVLVERDGRETEIAVARYARTGPGSADVAIVVADAWQGKGIGRRLLVRLLEVARARGISRFEGEMLTENEPIRGLLASLGFTFHREPDGGDLLFFERVYAPGEPTGGART